MKTQMKVLIKLLIALLVLAVQFSAAYFFIRWLRLIDPTFLNAFEKIL